MVGKLNRSVLPKVRIRIATALEICLKNILVVDLHNNICPVQSSDNETEGCSVDEF